MRDPFGSMQAMMQQFQQFRQNPMQFMMQRNMNIPQQFQNDPQGAIQYLMNSGRITQDQYNTANRMARQIQNNPMFQQLMNGGNQQH